VIGVKALASIEGAPAALAGARAWAEDVASPKPAPKGPTAKPAPVQVAANPNPPLPPPVSASAPKAAPQACAPSAAELARAANLSPAELQVLQSLGTRRGQLDQREKDLDAQLQLLAVAGAKLDTKLAAMTRVKGEIQGLLGQVDQKQDAEVARLVSVYEKMRPKDAAAVMSSLDDRVRVPVAAKMKDRALAAVLSAMSPNDARHLTELLARRFADVSSMAQAIANPPPPVADPPPTPDAKPAAKPAAKTPARRSKSAALQSKPKAQKVAIYRPPPQLAAPPSAPVAPATPAVSRQPTPSVPLPAEAPPKVS
jgi:flagellar motility protein MotE (MotC chaperone)